MFDSLAIQYLVQTPDYRPFSITEGYISGCVSGITPVLGAGRRVLVDKTIVPQSQPSNSSTTKNIERNIRDVLNRSRFMVAVPLEEF